MRLSASGKAPTAGNSAGETGTGSTSTHLNLGGEPTALGVSPRETALGRVGKSIQPFLAN